MWHIVLRLLRHVTVKIKSHVAVNADMIVLVSSSVRPSKKLGFQSTSENWQ